MNRATMWQFLLLIALSLLNAVVSTAPTSGFLKIGEEKLVSVTWQEDGSDASGLSTWYSELTALVDWTLPRSSASAVRRLEQIITRERLIRNGEQSRALELLV
jgi:hypothetical protein